MSLIELALSWYLGIGLVAALIMLWMMRNVPASLLVVIRDGINITLFYPYLFQLWLLNARRKRAMDAYTAAAYEQLKANPEKFKQDTMNMMKKMMDETIKTDDKNVH